MSITNAIRRVRAERNSQRDQRIANAIRSVRLTTLGVQLSARASKNGNYDFRGLAYSGGIMYPTIYSGGKTITGATVLDLDSLIISKREVPVLDNHDESPEGVIGRTLGLDLNLIDYELPVHGVIYGKKARASRCIKEARAGRLWQMSVGVDGFTLQEIEKGELCPVNGRELWGPFNLISGAYLTDLSIVEHGADDQTFASIECRRQRRQRFLAVA